MTTDQSETPELLLREASAGDIPVMAQHHRMMFEEIWAQKGEALSVERAGEIEKAYARKLEAEMSGLCTAWVIEEAGEIIASGAITLVSFVPHPYDPSSKVAYLHSIYTEKSHRNRKCAGRIIEAAIRHCLTLGISRMILSASNAGKPIYEKIGFRSTPEMMRLFIK